MDTTDLERRLVELTRDLVVIPSAATYPDDLERCVAMVRNHIEYLGHVEVCEHRSEGVPSLLALPPDNTRPDVLLCAHLDVIAHERQAYRTIVQDGRIYGPGTGDMKGQLAVLMELFRAFHANSGKPSLGLCVTADEEAGGDHGVRYLFEQSGLRCGVCIVPDGGGCDTLVVEEKGLLHMELSCHGRAAHAARPWLGDNALDRMVDATVALRQRFELLAEAEDHWHPTCTVTIVGTPNLASNRVPDAAHATVDIRFPAPCTVDEIMTLVRQTLPPEIQITLHLVAEPTRMSPDPAFADAAKTVTGRTYAHSRENGGSDARFICAHDIPVIMTRPQVGNLHAADEWIDIQSMLEFYRICETYLKARLD